MIEFDPWLPEQSTPARITNVADRLHESSLARKRTPKAFVATRHKFGPTS